jgi:tungstate transport system substrate-binding protein
MTIARTVLLTCLCALLITSTFSQPPTGQANPSSVQPLQLASTIGPVDAGIVGALADAFQKQSGIPVHFVGAGTGEALKMAQTGKFDLVLVHARALEEKFVEEGYGTKRYDLMYNDFVILGPPNDPAGIKGEKSAVAAFKKIAAAQALFISRGDRSGTNIKELEIWKAAGLEPSGSWYKIYELGKEGNAKTLRYANQEQAYTLMDRATYVTLKNELKLQILVEKDTLLLNYITLIPVNPAKFPNVKYKEAMKFIDFATSEDGQRIIRDFGREKYGEPLFFPNSPAGKKLP